MGLWYAVGKLDIRNNYADYGNAKSDFRRKSGSIHLFRVNNCLFGSYGAYTILYGQNRYVFRKFGQKFVGQKFVFKFRYVGKTTVNSHYILKKSIE